MSAKLIVLEHLGIALSNVESLIIGLDVCCFRVGRTCLGGSAPSTPRVYVIVPFLDRLHSPLSTSLVTTLQSSESDQLCFRLPQISDSSHCAGHEILRIFSSTILGSRNGFPGRVRRPGRL